MTPLVFKKIKVVVQNLANDPAQLLPYVRGKLFGILKKPVASPVRVSSGAARILFDVSATREYDNRTGIQRVVKSITEAMRRVAPTASQPVYLSINTLRSADDFLMDGRAWRNPAVVLHPGDCFLMLDSCWSEFNRFETYFDQIRAGGGSVCAVVYDVIPILHPELVSGFLAESFAAWFKSAIVKSDALICISRSAADEVIGAIKDLDLPHRPNLRVGYFHLGADIPHRGEEATVRTQFKTIFDGARPHLLMVGTVEPRKRHADALAAVEELWRAGSDLSLTIIGRYGWKTAQLADRLRTHPEKGKRLFWVEDASDAEVQFAYRSATALLFPTIAEGYGLPLIEAAYFDLPVICSDLPVLRELAGENAVYFRKGDPASAAKAIRMFLDGQVQADPTKIERLTWDESAEQLIRVIRDQAWHATLE